MVALSVFMLHISFLKSFNRFLFFIIYNNDHRRWLTYFIHSFFLASLLFVCVQFFLFQQCRNKFRLKWAEEKWKRSEWWERRKREREKNGIKSVFKFTPIKQFNYGKTFVHKSLGISVIIVANTWSIVIWFMPFEHITGVHTIEWENGSSNYRHTNIQRAAQQSFTSVHTQRIYAV